jgi:anaerobic magnesium-protoporphyrin IX monomethyl ester cyclase
VKKIKLNNIFYNRSIDRANYFLNKNDQMKIILIQPPWYGFQNILSLRPYLGLAYLGAVLEKAGHNVLILNGETFFKNINNEGEGVTVNKDDFSNNFSADHYVYRDIMAQVKNFSPDIIGISFMTAGSSSAYILAKLIKEYCPKLPIIAGGVHPTLVPEEPLKKSCFDFVVKGEGELTMPELVDALEKNKGVEGINGLYFIKDGTVVKNQPRLFITDLDMLPYPAFHLLYDLEKQKSTCKGIITSRGCPFECNYCASKLMWTRSVRFRSPDNVVGEIKDRHEKLGIKSFGFHDDTFTLRKPYVMEMCQKISDLDFKISWHCDTRGDTLDKPMLAMMKKAGCNQIYLGLESGSPKIQQMIKKRIDTAKVKTAIDLARAVGIETTVYFMVGFPDETEDDIMESIKTMKYLNPDHTIWSILTPYPGTETWEIAEKRGMLDINTNWDKFFHHFNQGNIFKTLSDDRWNAMIDLIDREQKKQEKRITSLKLKKKFLNYLYLFKLGINNPKKILGFIKKRIKFAL